MTLRDDIREAMARLCDAEGYNTPSDYATPQLRIDAFASVTAIAVANAASAIVVFDGELDDTYGCRHYAANSNFLLNPEDEAAISLLKVADGEALFKYGEFKFTANSRAENLIIEAVMRRAFCDSKIPDVSPITAFASKGFEIEFDGTGVEVHDALNGRSFAFATEGPTIGFRLKVSADLLRMVLECFDVVDMVLAKGPASEIIVKGSTCGYQAVAVLMPLSH